MSLQSILTLVFNRFTYFSKEKLLLILKALISNNKILDKKYEAQKLKNKLLEEKISELEVIKVTQEKKYCPHCKKVSTAKSEIALQKSDFGLNTTTTKFIYYTVLL